MQTTTAGDAAAGATYLSPTGRSVVVKGASAAPGFVDLVINGRTVPVPDSYRLTIHEQDTGVSAADLAGLPEPELRERLPELTSDQLDELARTDSRMWLLTACADEQERRSTPAATDATCPICAVTVTIRPAVSRGGVLVMATHPAQGSPGMCSASGRTVEEAELQQELDDDKRLANMTERYSTPSNKLPRVDCPVCDNNVALRRGGELREHQGTHPVLTAGEHGKCQGSGHTVEQAQAMRTKADDKANAIEAAQLDLQNAIDEQRPHDTDATTDVFLTASNTQDRIAKIKRWGYDELERCAEQYPTNQGLQSVVVREIGRQADALAKIDAIDVSMQDGRDELLRLRGLSTTRKRSGVIHRIDAILQTLTTATPEQVADNVAERLTTSPPLVDDETRHTLPIPQIPEDLAAWLDAQGVDEQVACFTVAALVRNVRDSRSACKATRDDDLLLLAWRWLVETEGSTTVKKGVANRYKRLTGQLPTMPDPITDEDPDSDTAQDVDSADQDQETPTRTPEPADAPMDLTGLAASIRAASLAGAYELIAEADPAELAEAFDALNSLGDRRPQVASRISQVLQGKGWKWTGKGFDNPAEPEPQVAPEPEPVTADELTEPEPEPEPEPVTRRQAELEGVAACEAGQPIGSNPYPQGSPQRDAWNLGWIDAEPAPQPAPKPQPVQVQLKHLKIIDKPDGTADVWACQPGSTPTLVGPAEHPELAPVVAQWRALQTQECAAQAPLDTSVLGQLGAVLEALKATGATISLTISVGGGQ